MVKVEFRMRVMKLETDLAKSITNCPPSSRGLQYLSVCFPYSGTSRNQAYKQQYQRLQRDTGMKYKKGFFFKTLRSEVMASFTHLE